jgi:hypothetical protein
MVRSPVLTFFSTTLQQVRGIVNTGQRQGTQRLAGYAAVLGIAFLARAALSAFDVQFITHGQETVWSWPFFGVFLLAFLLAVPLAQGARLPSPGETLRSRAGLALPVAIGMAIGLLTLWSDILSPAAAARGVPTLHVRGPAAVPFYLYGGVLLTVVFHFLPIALAAGVARWLPRAAARAAIVAGIVVVALSEDLMFFLRTPALVTVESGRHVLSVLANAAEAGLIYRFGLLSGLLQRWTAYLLWHIAWPALGSL